MEYFNYDYIPDETRTKLPSKNQLIYEVEQEQGQKSVKWWYGLLSEAIESKSVARYRNEIREMKIPVADEKINGFARKAAVFECILNHYAGRKGELTALHQAYKQHFTNGYTMKNRFRMAVTQAKKDGVLSVSIDSRYLSGLKKVFGSHIEYRAMLLLSSGKKYGISQVHRLLSEECRAGQCPVPSLSWLRGFARRPETANSVREQRIGAGLYSDTLPKATIIPAEYAGDQWQIDGWRIPVYCKSYDKGGKVKYFATYNLQAVMDTHSRKIIAATVTESENTESILNALELAVKNTGILPFEIVMDNHSFNRTTEAGNIREQFEKKGVRWTVDSNPRRKAILERGFKKLGEEYFKFEYGYKGQGIRTRDKNGLTSPELMEEYTKPDTFLDRDQLCAVVARAVVRYNSGIVRKLKATPEQRYEESETPHAFKVDVFERMKLFVRRGEYTVSAGQVTVERAGHRYGYVLPSEYIHRFNGQKVTVRYKDFDEIYVYDMEDNPVCIVKQKAGIHGAKANQTLEDIENLNKLSGKKKGVRNQAAKTRRKVYEDACRIAPE
ncbi:MAG: transposase family protein, partial [Tannerella sp.]|nr:transposase family protein [Tannerella sp.]